MELCRQLDAFYEAVKRRESPRLIFCLPPRHGKSELVSRRFPAWCFGRDPDLEMIATSYSERLAARMNRDVQRIIDSESYRVIFPRTELYDKSRHAGIAAPGSYVRNSEIFEIVGHRGSYRSAGVGQGIGGMGADILIVDDPVKDWKQASSITVRNGIAEWFASTAYTRLAPGGGVLLCMTRWNEDDLAGRLISPQDDENADPWRVFAYPAIAERDEEHRKMGEALHPERYGLERLLRIKAAITKNLGSRIWTALYGQQPAPDEGDLLRMSWFRRFREAPAAPTRIVQSWDTGNKPKRTNDPSVCGTWLETDTGSYLVHVLRERLAYPDLKRTAVNHALAWGPGAVLIEDKASGQSLIQDLRAETRLPVIGIDPTPDGDKLVRFTTTTPLIEAGRVWLPENAAWLPDYESELTHFPNGAYDDQVDMTSQYLRWAYKTRQVVDIKMI